MITCDNCKYAFCYPTNEGAVISACHLWQHDLVGRRTCVELRALMDWEQFKRDTPDIVPSVDVTKDLSKYSTMGAK